MSVIQTESLKFLQLSAKQLEECLQVQPFERAVECAFSSLKTCWSQLKKVVVNNEFESEEEEIHFFKVLKPKLIAELEYYGLVYHSILFCPPDAEQKLLFWQREADRLQEFKIMYSEFYSYYVSGSTHHDTCYFKRKRVHPQNREHSESKAKTTHDHLVSKLLAFEKYADYALSHLSKA
jgi:hypothetical protein